MLFLSRKSGDTVFIGDEITVEGQVSQSASNPVANTDEKSCIRREEDRQPHPGRAPGKKTSIQRD